ncbi:hypothetical protein PR202_gb14930 [Eleusine coracana subsp. coracana]|uniref:Uncharacterized protein n=1 Tax=Eleusine coracana subsp. coracana TaxID=191504 RepID=A0AAV5EWJ3_ELECO|nr:hypothetical protein QOZ80_4BG0340970 [Eleusine coracana subsp. coracana]GJN26961.1 hypothetical protein PR202_gb14930 [Eleusine coracana subsp. coracana]
MKSPSVALLLLLLAVAMASRLSLVAAAGGESGGSIAAIVGHELRGLVARADNIFRSAGGWHTASGGVAEAKNLRAVAARRRPRKSGGARCVTAAMCRKRRVICGKRCYGGSRAASVNHVPRCVVKCRKCVPTC